MDGAGKFVRGDAVAAVLITGVNILGGLYLGVVEHGMSPGEAVEVFTKLTIGDGLVSQVPAFLISLAAGLIVTRSSSETDLGRDVTGQLFRHPEVLGVAAAFLALMGFSGLPKLPMLSLAGALGAGAYVLWGRQRRDEETAEPAPTPTGSRGHAAGPTPASAPTARPAPGPAPAAPPAEPPSERVDDLLRVDPLEVEVGYRLIGLADPARGDLLERIRGVRQRVARELGLIVPQVRIRDEIGLGPNDYRFKIRGAVVGRGTAYAGRLLAVPPSGLVTRPDGRDAVDPISGRPAVWIHADGREVAELAGCRVLEAAAVIAGHFGEAVLEHADELVTHDQVRQLLDRARRAAPTLVEEVVPGRLRTGEVRRVLQHLVRERVSVRDLEVILESLAEHADASSDVDALVEHARRALGRRLLQPHLDAEGRLHAVVLSGGFDALLAAGPSDGPSVEDARAIVRAVGEALAPRIEAGAPLVVLCTPEARPVLKDLTRADLPRLAVLARDEVPRGVPVEVVGVAEETLPGPPSRTVKVVAT
jgi:flagellar biosynthesis protein FlhA